jgi:hypothetical protein
MNKLIVFGLLLQTTILLGQENPYSSGLDGYMNAKEQENNLNYPSLADAVALFQANQINR